MNRAEFLNDGKVIEFIEWLKPKIDKTGEFKHGYILQRPKGKGWSCVSIYDAYQKYSWPFNCTLPIEGVFKGTTFEESEEVLNKISRGLVNSLKDNDNERFRQYSLSVLQWGGVLNKNKDRINDMGDDLISYFKNAIVILDPDTTDTASDFNHIIMNSGFTKIYSLLVSDFIIYDGRVGATLALLVRLFIEDCGDFNIPKQLNFAYGNARVSKYEKNVINRRNPSNDNIRFPQLTNNPILHIDNNIRANWLIKKVLEESMFCNNENPIRKFEAALFMIGYDVRSYFE